MVCHILKGPAHWSALCAKGEKKNLFTYAVSSHQGNKTLRVIKVLFYIEVDKNNYRQNHSVV